jgi:hypothetical protein
MAKKLTAKEAAAKLHGCEYREEGSDELFKQMDDAGLVAAFGASDDLLEFRGAIEDEVGAWDGTTVYLDAAGLIQRRCDDEDCPYDKERMEAAEKSGKRIEAAWAPKDPDCSWLIKSDIPHEPFDVMEDGGLYCRGIVFRLSDAGGN